MTPHSTLVALACFFLLIYGGCGAPAPLALALVCAFAAGCTRPGA